jgi:hypothetical protein
MLSDNHYTFTATATDRAGNTATSNYSTTVDTTPPGVTNITSAAADQHYHPGDGIDITLAFDENVHVTGTPTLSLNSGGTATYTGGDGTNTLTFHYTVAAGETTTDLNVTELVLGSDVSIQDSAGNDASLTLPASHATGALDAIKDIVIGSTITYLTDTDTPSNGSSGNGESSISADGHYVTFYSGASNLTGTADANGKTSDIFVYDTLTHTTTNITDGGNGDSYFPSISADGHYVTFQSGASNLTDTADINSGVNNVIDIFVYDTLTHTTTNITDGGNGQSCDPSISADGHYVTFQSEATNLTGNFDHNGNIPDIFVYDTVAHTTSNITNGANGYSFSPSISAGRWTGYQSSYCI